MPTYTAKDKPDLDQYKDRTGQITIENLTVDVQIKDARLRFGHIDLLVTPVLGAGSQWVEQHRVEIEDADQPKTTPIFAKIGDAFGKIPLDEDPF